jgi:hypothetical protein
MLFAKWPILRACIIYSARPAALCSSALPFAPRLPFRRLAR